MGSVSVFNIDWVISQYGTKQFIETGTYKGDGVRFALSKPFEKIISIEINPEFYNKAKETFADPRLVLILGDSLQQLEPVAALTLTREPALWWLDAHLGTKENPYPLEKELKIIKNFRDISGDVFIMDDLRLYAKGEFGHGNFKDDGWGDPGNDEFFKRLLGNTHVLTPDFRHEGYMTAFPKPKI
jgi:hypothetical protein